MVGTLAASAYGVKWRGWGSNAEKRVQGWIEAACSGKHRESVRED